MIFFMKYYQGGIYVVTDGESVARIRVVSLNHVVHLHENVLPLIMFILRLELNTVSFLNIAHLHYLFRTLFNFTSSIL